VAARQIDAAKAVAALRQVDEVYPRSGRALLFGGLFLSGNRRHPGGAAWDGEIPA